MAKKNETDTVPAAPPSPAPWVEKLHAEVAKMVAERGAYNTKKWLRQQHSSLLAAAAPDDIAEMVRLSEALDFTGLVDWYVALRAKPETAP